MKRHLLAPLVAIALFVVFAVTSLSQNKVGGRVPKESEAIEFGLSVKWAPWNIGASQASDYGEYFAWGEVVPKKDSDGNYCSYYWHTYCFGNYAAKQTLFKYNEVDGKTTLESSDDAATANWGGKWRMPTQVEFAELSDGDNCEWTWTDNYNESGHSGYVVKSKKSGYEDAVLFLPAAGCQWISYLYSEGTYGYYWSSELSPWNSSYAIYLFFSSGDRNAGSNFYRCLGFSVRPVCPPAE